MRDLISDAPLAGDAAQAQARFDDLLTDAPEDADDLSDGRVKPLLLGIAAHSSYLWQLIRSDRERLRRLLETPPKAGLAKCLATLAFACDAAQTDAEVMRLLRRAKQEVALLVAMADLGGVWTAQNVMAALTAAADVFVRSALRFALRQAIASKHLVCADAANPEEGCGVVVLALGKHGAGELNYSSDTDLIVLFDHESSLLAGHAEAATFFVRLTRHFVKILQERTADGYVLRVDLRLRPDPGSTAIAISLSAAFSYYELYGQNWERAALIKARPIAGDLQLGAEFLQQLRPFIWRKYLDYAAVTDIHAMKRQIHAVRGHADVTVAGHDVKLGRGGIREIEFFVQTQQLIYGGKKTELRGSMTLAMLAELAREGLVSEVACSDLTAAYLFLREIEHRLQMIADEQTQRLPKDETELTCFAAFCGYANLASFSEIFIFHLTCVAEHYASLFESAPVLSSDIGNLVFTGVADDPETLETLSRLGFARSALAAETIRGWHFGRHAAMRSERAREILTEFAPALLQAFAQTADPDMALAAFDSALGRMKAVAELLAILKSNVHLRELFASILGSAPRLAEMVVRRPHVLDAAMDATRLSAQLDVPALKARLDAQLATHTNTEDFLDLLRDFAQEESFLIGTRLLADLVAPEAAGSAYTALAESVVDAALAHVLETFAEKHGRVPGGRCIILGLGKLGSCEMTAASDLDLVLIYDFDADRPASDGPQALDALTYYTRVTQRLISSLTVATRCGRLYEVDMRLRPSGRKGPVATQFSSFSTYQSKEAESWEHMALSRARVIAGDPSLAADVETERCAILARAPVATLRDDIAEMRRLIAQEKSSRGPFDLKYAEGGLVDIDFVAQYLCLAHAHEDRRLLVTSPAFMLTIADEAGYIASEMAAVLLAARRLYGDVLQILYTLVDAENVMKPLNSAVARRLAKSAGLPDLNRLLLDVAEARSRVKSVFSRMVG
ncbi:MAG: bifunctional [glutamine synthetase] adenylyltransferase/[glutamine synthetase]-adenylyl-L-tyrosine phosphorylase [Beijerinckiaceae bacterium]|nr:MAG: bifunctional [glutamine synthetase] adenylyltransferase/[glutamine synthetase]-adenylyl-L-tyrosine phosphorylase [Beijerinckiaceae bacterium]